MDMNCYKSRRRDCRRQLGYRACHGEIFARQRCKAALPLGGFFGNLELSILIGWPLQRRDTTSVQKFANDVAGWSNGRVDLLVSSSGQDSTSTFSDASDVAWRA